MKRHDDIGKLYKHIFEDINMYGIRINDNTILLTQRCPEYWNTLIARYADYVDLEYYWQKVDK